MRSPSPTIPRTSNLFITLPMSGIFMKSKDAEVVHVWAERSRRPEDGTEIAAQTGHCSKNLLPVGRNALLIIHTHTYILRHYACAHTLAHLRKRREVLQRRGQTESFTQACRSNVYFACMCIESVAQFNAYFICMCMKWHVTGYV